MDPQTMLVPAPQRRIIMGHPDEQVGVIIPGIQGFKGHTTHLFDATAMHPTAAAAHKWVAISQNGANACNDGRPLSIH